MTERSCARPCRRVVRAEYISAFVGGMPEELSRAQTRAFEMGVHVADYVPQDDGTMRYVVECEER
jgi:hypothetical protein